MAKVYAPPAGLEPPEWDYSDFDRVLKEEELYIKSLREAARLRVTRDTACPDLIGETIRFPRADGYAQYMVWSARPLHIVHLPVGDAWHADPILLRGLRLSDVKEMVARQQGLKKLFATR